MDELLARPRLVGHTAAMSEREDYDDPGEKHQDTLKVMALLVVLVGVVAVLTVTGFKLLR
jgi:hypothetical protein